MGGCLYRSELPDLPAPPFLSPPAFMAPRCCGVGESEMPLMSDSASRRAVEFLKKTQAKATREVKEQRKKKKRRTRFMGCGCLLLLLAVPVFGVFVITSMMVMGKASHDALVQQRESKYQNSCVNRVAPNGKYANPAVGTITSRFGLRDNPIPGATLADLTDHPGTDIAGMAEGTPFYAAAAGTVLVVDSGGAAGGNGIIIQGDDGVRYWYWHAATGTAKVKAGDHVEVGQELAGAGMTGYATGVHLHFQIMLPDPNNPDGKGIPTDPEPYMLERGITLGQGAPDQVSDTQKTDAPANPEVKAPKTEAPSPKVDITPIETDLPSGSKYTWNEKRVANAADIIAVGKGMGVPERGIIIALMTSLQENALENTPDGDRDSVGLFQQRPSAGWGTAEQVHDPKYAAAAFYGGPEGPNHGNPPGLLDYPGWESKGLGEAAQMVQISAYPYEYSKWENTARQLYSVLSGVDGNTTYGKQSCPNNKGSEGSKDEGSKDSDKPQKLTVEADGVHTDKEKEVRDTILAKAREGLGGSYAQGRNDFKNWDATGYVHWVYGQAGIELPRQTPWTVGETTTDPQPGDLVAQVGDGEGNYAHVGIYAGNGKMYSVMGQNEGTVEHDVNWNGAGDTEYIRIVHPKK